MLFHLKIEINTLIYKKNEIIIKYHNNNNANNNKNNSAILFKDYDRVYI